MDIHHRIKARRTELGMSMQDLATAVGLKSWQAVQQWEKPDSEEGTAPRRARLKMVADALKVTPEWLQFGAPDEPAAESAPVARGLREMQIEAAIGVLRALNDAELATCLGWMLHQFGDRIKRGEDQTSENVNEVTASKSGNITSGPREDSITKEEHRSVGARLFSKSVLKPQKRAERLVGVQDEPRGGDGKRRKKGDPA